MPGVEQVVAIAGMSVLDSNSAAGQCRRRLRHPQGLGRARQGGGRGPALDRHAHQRATRRSCRTAAPSRSCRRRSRASAMPAASRCRSSSATAASTTPSCRTRRTNLIAQAQHASRRWPTLVTSFRAGAPHVRVDVDRVKAETLKVSVGDVFSTLSSYLGSTYVNRFNKFGLSLQVYVQADSQYRTRPEDILQAAGAQRRRHRWCRSARWRRSARRPGRR